MQMLLLWILLQHTESNVDPLFSYFKLQKEAVPSLTTQDKKLPGWHLCDSWFQYGACEPIWF